MKVKPMSKQNTTPKAVIYCRVSSTAQVTKGDGLGSQETRCREYAKHKQYKIVEVFKDEGVSGSLIDRPGMQAMLKFLRASQKKQHVVIIDDISRLARGLEAHIQLRMAIGEAGGKLESPSIEFGDDSDSQLVENLLASVSQHQRQKNTEQVINRMQARMMNGYWVFFHPIGYRYERVSGHGKMLVRDEPLASIITETLEGYARGRFETQSEVKRFLESHEAFPRGRDGKVHYQRVNNLLVQVLYSGYITYSPWNITLHPGKHEPLISYETFQAIQERLNGQSKAPARKDLNADFPLRGFVTCGCCGSGMTACWSRGRDRSYPYYLCPQKGCQHYGKSIRKEILEKEFETLLGELRPSPNLFYLALEMFKELWSHRQQQARQEGQLMQGELRRIGNKIDQFLDRMVDADTSMLVETYENKVSELQKQQVILNEKIKNCGRPLQSFDESFRTAFDFLGNPYKLWSSDRLEDKRMVLRLAFSEKLPYYRREGFRTAPTALPFRLLSDLKGGGNGMVEGTGVEPATPTLRT